MEFDTTLRRLTSEDVATALEGEFEALNEEYAGQTEPEDDDDLELPSDDDCSIVEDGEASYTPSQCDLSRCTSQATPAASEVSLAEPIPFTR